MLNPEAESAQGHLTKRGFVLLTCGVYANVNRSLPPITIPDDVLAESMDILERQSTQPV